MTKINIFLASDFVEVFFGRDQKLVFDRGAWMSRLKVNFSSYACFAPWFWCRRQSLLRFHRCAFVALIRWLSAMVGPFLRRVVPLLCSLVSKGFSHGVFPPVAVLSAAAPARLCAS